MNLIHDSEVERRKKPARASERANRLAGIDRPAAFLRAHCTSSIIEIPSEILPADKIYLARVAVKSATRERRGRLIRFSGACARARVANENARKSTDSKGKAVEKKNREEKTSREKQRKRRENNRSRECFAMLRTV